MWYITCSLTFQMKFFMRGTKNVVTETVTKYRFTENNCAEGTARMDMPVRQVVMEAEWFHAIDEDQDGLVSYYFGVSPFWFMDNTV